MPLSCRPAIGPREVAENREEDSTSCWLPSGVSSKESSGDVGFVERTGIYFSFVRWIG